MSVPAVRAIKDGRPDVHVTIAAPGQDRADVEAHSGSGCDYSFVRGVRLLSVVRFFEQQTPFDVAILFPNSLRVALEVLAERNSAKSWLSRPLAKLAR